MDPKYASAEDLEKAAAETYSKINGTSKIKLFAIIIMTTKPLTVKTFHLRSSSGF